MKRSLVLLVCFFLVRNPLFPAEGMWIPMLLQYNIGEMQSLGFRLTAGDIYNINHSSMKDGIVQYGRGCTGVIVSPEGLMLTNHHCGYGSIQTHSTLDHDYLADGFWALTRDQELSNPGLTVTLLVSMEDVTGQVLEGVTATMTERERSEVIKRNTSRVEKSAAKESWQDARVRSFYYGNAFYLLITVTYRDVRLVGAPPSSIGKFGGDTDNWIWPRHTGDFSVFRIYADKDNHPADYSPSNVPYRPSYYFPVSLKGYQANDFTMVFGFPGTTREYLPSWGVELTAHGENPVRIALRQKRMDIIQTGMDTSRLIRIQYANKYAGIANYWKKMMGETRGIDRMDEISLKRELERRYAGWADSSNDRRMRYGGLSEAFRTTYEAYTPVSMAAVYLSEAGMAPELTRFAAGFEELVNLSEKKDVSQAELKKEAEKLKGSSRSFYRNYQPAIDREVLAAMLPEMQANLPQEFLPDVFMEITSRHHGNTQEYAGRVFSSSIFADSARLFRLLNEAKASDIRKLRKDPGLVFALSVTSEYNKVVSPLAARYTSHLDSLQRIWLTGLMEMQKERRFYPDANSTLRVAYGKVSGFSPADAVEYNYFTTSAGILQKEDSLVYDYQVDPKLRSLLERHEFGPYADPDGTLHVAFIATNHTSGGNSGSPVLNAEGQLLGLNFDRNWEGTVSDLAYDPDQCRNITLDIRYCLFIMDRFAGAGVLVNEMTLVR